VWVFPVVSAVLLVASLVAYLPTHTKPSKWLRVLSLGLIGLLVATDVASMVKLVGTSSSA